MKRAELKGVILSKALPEESVFVRRASRRPELTLCLLSLRI